MTDNLGLLCRRCKLRHLEVRPVITRDGREAFECIDRSACRQRMKWASFFKKKKK